MQSYNIDENKLIVSWNRYEQGLMKTYLMKCACSNDVYCFGDKKEFSELYEKLMKHGFPPVEYNICSHEQAVHHIKNLIRSSLKPAQGQNGSTIWSWINDEKETQFLTRFAMAIQDTKIRGTYIPESSILDTSKQHISPNLISASGITFAKAKLLSLATQLTRIGLNCQTTVHHAQNLRGPTQNAGLKRTINFIDTNNFLGRGVLKMDQLGIGMEPVNYYFNLYRKLFDLALKREWDQKQNGEKPKIPRFLIPLTHYWGQTVSNPLYGKHIDINLYIKQALEKLLKIKYNKTQTYGQLIAVDILDYNRSQNPINAQLFNKNNWPYGRIIDNNFREPLFYQQDTYEDYAIGSGDHYTFIGNECMGCWNGTGSPSSHEAFAMKTDFPKFYGQYQGFANNEYYIIDPKLFNMPTKYQLHMNYQNDRIVDINEQQQSINNFAKYGTNNYYSNIQKQYQ